VPEAWVEAWFPLRDIYKIDEIGRFPHRTSGALVKWNGSVALISGASRGIGAELARQVVAKGGKVGLLARTTADLEQLKAELGDTCAIATADVTSTEDLEAAVKTVEAALGAIDILVNNAGIGLYAAFLDTDVEDFDRMMRTNYLGVVRLLKAVLGKTDRVRAARQGRARDA